VITPSSCSTAPSGISSQLLRSMARVIMARLRIRDVAMGGSPHLWEMTVSGQSSWGDKRLLLRKSTIYLIAQVLRQLDPQLLALRREQVARPR
jgi:hypothetical protein